MDYIIPEEKLLELVRRIKCDNSITMQNVKSYFLVNLKFDLDSNIATKMQQKENSVMIVKIGFARHV